MREKSIEKYNICLNIFMLVYIVATYINKVKLIYLVGFLLMYITLNILYFLLRKKFILIVSAIINFIVGLKLMPLIMILYSFNIIELFVEDNRKKILMFILLGVPFVYLKEDILKYIIFSGMSYTFLGLYYEFIKETNKLDYDIEEKRKIIHKLTDKLDKAEDFNKQSVHTIKLEERNKLSQDIHDKVGHTIAGSLMQLEAIKIMVDKDINKVKPMLDNTIKVLRAGMDDIRRILREINPPNEQIGINKIKLLLEEKTVNTKFNFTLLHNGDITKISKKQWLFIYEGIRETSTNSMKYSKGNKINVKIEALNKLIRIEINDNGIGAGIVKKGIGLNSIEQKVLDLEGKLIVDGSNGFCIVFLLPVENENNVLSLSK